MMTDTKFNILVLTETEVESKGECGFCNVVGRVSGEDLERELQCSLVIGRRELRVPDVSFLWNSRIMVFNCINVAKKGLAYTVSIFDSQSHYSIYFVPLNDICRKIVVEFL